MHKAWSVSAYETLARSGRPRIAMLKPLVALLLTGISADASELAPFTSDGCSSFPDGVPENKTLWLNCCIKHDLAYWKGGSFQERLNADLELERCVARAGEAQIAKLMLQGVRAGGSPYLLTPFRWGYGWPYGRGYRALSDQEKLAVTEQLKSLAAMIDELLRQ